MYLKNNDISSMFYDLGVVFYVRVNNYIYMYVLPPQYVEAKTSHKKRYAQARTYYAYRTIHKYV